MNQRGRLLLADDEVTFLHSTAELLRREGYHCDTVTSGDAALSQVADAPYDLLITDLEMPGNADLSLVRELAQRAGGLPVIIITGFPSTRSAIASVELPVTAYLVKPVHFPELLERVDRAVSRFRTYQVMRTAEERLETLRSDSVLLQSSSDGHPPGSEVDAFLALTLRNVMGSLTDLQQLSQALHRQPVKEHPCQLINCPRGRQLHEAVTETIRVLEETKGAFKSKTLADLRRRLELLLQVG
jgi:CheY-like chemotaxis protein